MDGRMENNPVDLLQNDYDTSMRRADEEAGERAEFVCFCWAATCSLTGVRTLGRLEAGCFLFSCSTA